MLVEDLPEILILEILSRLPVKSLLRIKSVCKQWCALITDPTFIKVHINRSLSSNSNLSLVFAGLNCISVSLDAVEQGSLVELDHPLKRPHDETSSIGSCNGLLCIYNYEDDIYLWNPSTRTHQKLPITLTLSPHSICFPSLYGFGYDPITDDYKLVRIVQFGCDDHNFNQEVKVYSLRTNSWRRISDLPFQLMSLRHRHRFGVLANHVLHWVAKRKMGPIISTFILSFSLQDEEFREVPLPKFVDNKVDLHFGERGEIPNSHFVANEVYVNLGVLEGQLCLIYNFLWSHIEVWVMKEYGLKDSWVKLFSTKERLVVFHVFIRPICYSNKGEIIFEMDSKELVLYDPAGGRAKSVLIEGFSHLVTFQACGFCLGRFETEICNENLVLLKYKDGANQAKRKRTWKTKFRYRPSW